MALIECKACGKQVSDRAKVCPNCGEVLIPEAPVELQKCEDCGNDLPVGATVCPNCGCPVSEVEAESTPQKVEVTKVSMSVDKEKAKKLAGIVIGVVVIVALIVVSIFVSKSNQAKKAAAEYADNFDLCVSSMFIGASSAESACGLIHDVWYNCIYEEWDDTTNKYTRDKWGDYYSDFNDALSNLFSDISFISKISGIKSNQDLVAGLMKELKNPPEEYNDAYDALKELYEVYCDLTECAVNPSGNLSGYTSTFNAADSDFVKYYKAVKLYQ